MKSSLPSKHVVVQGDGADSSPHEEDDSTNTPQRTGRGGVGFFRTSQNSKDDSSTATNSNNKPKKSLKTWRRDTDEKVPGLKRFGLDETTYEKRHKLMVASNHSRRSGASRNAKLNASKKFSVEEMEEEVRAQAIQNPFRLLYLGNLAALKVMVYYMSK